MAAVTLFAQTTRQLVWDFPLDRPHAGILLGNGTQGLMVWGERNQLYITVARAGFWDHRGGNDFVTRIRYPELKTLLQARQDSAIQAAFAIPGTAEDKGFGHPQQLSGGRFVVEFPESTTLVSGKLDLPTGSIRLELTQGNQTFELIIQQHPTRELAEVTFPEAMARGNVSFLSAYELNTTAYQKAGILAPVARHSQQVHTVSQQLPKDEPLAVGWTHNQQRLLIGTALGQDNEASLIQTLLEGQSGIQAAAQNWWQQYWASVPQVKVPDPVLQEIHDYGLFKQACTTPPQGVAAALQGPFMEDYQIVPWSNDYHFNINLEMMYYPALMTGQYDHLDPLWDMIHRWWPEIEKNGQLFFGREGALMLPHAVDDRGKVVGTFWTGTIDHACTAWMAQLAWLHYSFSGEEEILTKTALPLLKGAFEGYWAMLERDETGVFHLPVSVSPEYRGSRMDAWGADASFQLAALHAVCDLLQKAASAANEAPDPRWEEVATHLPPYTTIEGVFQQEWGVSNRRIALWQDLDLIESHRHHSHLGSIWPFVTIDPLGDTHRDIVNNSLTTWRYRGAGGWSGWCVPWAAILMARTNQAEASVNWLHYWHDNFVNEGRGTLHNANTNGHSFIGAPVWAKLPEEVPQREVMQLDAGFGAITAVYELLVQQRQDGVHVFPGLSILWKEAEFSRIRVEGGFLISGKVEGGQVVEVTLEATRPGEIQLVHGMGDRFTVNGINQEGPVFQVKASPGQKWVLKTR